MTIILILVRISEIVARSNISQFGGSTFEIFRPLWRHQALKINKIAGNNHFCPPSMGIFTITWGSVTSHVRYGLRGVRLFSLKETEHHFMVTMSIWGGPKWLFLAVLFSFRSLWHYNGPVISNALSPNWKILLLTTHIYHGSWQNSILCWQCPYKSDQNDYFLLFFWFLGPDDVIIVQISQIHHHKIE